MSPLGLALIIWLIGPTVVVLAAMRLPQGWGASFSTLREPLFLSDLSRGAHVLPADASGVRE